MKANYTALIVALLDKLSEPELYIMYRTISHMVDRKGVER